MGLHCKVTALLIIQLDFFTLKCVSAGVRVCVICVYWCFSVSIFSYSCDGLHKNVSEVNQGKLRFTVPLICIQSHAYVPKQDPGPTYFLKNQQ